VTVTLREITALATDDGDDRRERPDLAGPEAVG
jgi:hypothetical protein